MVNVLMNRKLKTNHIAPFSHPFDLLRFPPTPWEVIDHRDGVDIEEAWQCRNEEQDERNIERLESFNINRRIDNRNNKT